MKFLLYFVLIVIVMTPSLALSDASSHAEKLKQLAMLENVSETITDYRNVCLERSKDYDPEKMVVSQPDMFAGVKPGSKYWPEVVSAFRKYVSISCDFITENEYLAEYIKVNTPLLTEEALDSILHFYSTPEGKAYLKATNTSRLTLQTYLVKKQTDKTKAGLDVYANKIREIESKKYASKR